MFWILAAGSQKRWGLALPKQLVPVGDELLILRQIRQIHQAGFSSTVVTSSRSIIHNVVTNHYYRNRVEIVEHSKSIIQTILTCLSKNQGLQGRQTFLLGDVIFTQDAINDVLNCDAGCRVFMRTDFSKQRLVGPYKEIFALSFGDAERDKVVKALTGVREQEKLGWWSSDGGKVRDFYTRYCGFDWCFNGQYPIDDQFIHWPINDLTDDIDSIEDYEHYVTHVISSGKIDVRH